MKYLPLVWSAVIRRPAETILVALAVMAAFTLFGLMVGLYTSYQRIVEATPSNRLYVNPRFVIATGLRMPLAMRDQIARLNGVVAVGALYQLRGYYQDPGNSGRIRAVDEEMRKAWPWHPLTAQQWDLLFSVPTGVLVSQAVAKKWGLKVGDAFPFITPPGIRADGAPFWEFQVLDIVPDDPEGSPDGFLVGNFGYIDRSRPLRDQSTAMDFEVAIADSSRVNEISLHIDRLFANSSTPTITIPHRASEENAIKSGVAAETVTLPVAGAGVFLVLLLVANGITQSVNERIPEFAVLKTLGFKDMTIAALVILETAVPCVFGAILGTGLAAVVTLWPSSSLPADLAELPKPTISTAVLMGAMIFVISLISASSTIPILKLRRLSIVDALSGRLQ